MRAFILVLLVACTAQDLCAQNPLDALVRLYATRSSIRGPQIGSGVFVDGVGTILTAYHVVQGARTVEVYGSAGSYGIATLVGYDEGRDLASVRILLPAGKNTHLPIGQVPKGLTKLTATIYGNPGGKGGAAIEAKFFWDEISPSSRYLAPDGGRLFAVDDTPLLGIDATLNRGMSGGPVVIDGKVIGIISGSDAPQGRNLGWAMPAVGMASLKPANGLTFESLPALKLLNRAESGSLLKSALPTARQEEMTRLLELSKRADSAYQQRLGEFPALLLNVNRALTMLPTEGLPSQDDRTFILKTAKEALQFESGLDDEHTAFLNDVRTPLLRDGPKELQAVTHVYDMVNKSLDTMIGDLNSLVASRAQKQGITDQDFNARLQDLNNRVTVLAAVARRIKAAVQIFSAVGNGAQTSVDIGPANVAYRAALKTWGDSIAEEILPNKPMPRTRELFEAVRTYSTTTLDAFRTDLQGTQQLIHAVDAVIDIYSAPEVVEFESM